MLGLSVVEHSKSRSSDQLMGKMNWSCENYVPFKSKYWMTLHATWIEVGFDSNLIQILKFNLNWIKVSLNWVPIQLNSIQQLKK